MIDNNYNQTRSVAHSDAPKPLGIRKFGNLDYPLSEAGKNEIEGRNQSQTMFGKKGGMR